MKKYFTQRRRERREKVGKFNFFSAFLRANLLLCFFLTSLNSFPQTIDDVNQYLKTLQSDAELKNASWSFCLKEVATGNTLASHNENLSLVPASIQKLITGGVTMNLLREDFRFVTKLEACELNIDSVQQFDVFITGGGDPTFCSEEMPGVMSEDSLFVRWQNKIHAENLAWPLGIIGDETFFEENDPPSDWLWEDLGNYYGASASGLNYHENYYSVYFTSGKIGTAAIVAKTYPPVSALEIKSFVTARGSGDNAYIYGSPSDFYREIKGTIPPNQSSFEIKGSMPMPEYWCANAFVDYMNANGYSISFPALTYSEYLNEHNDTGCFSKSSRYVLDSIFSPPLKDIISHMNDKSINLYAECLLKMLGKKMKVEGSTEKGIEAIEEFLASKNISLDGIHFEDGSGLARTNLVTANFFCDALSMFSQQESFNSFYETISVGGVSGFFKSMFLGTAAEGNIRVKSGTLSRVKNYAGYIDTKSGKRLSFCFMVNNFSCSSSDVKQKFETLMVKVAEME